VCGYIPNIVREVLKHSKAAQLSLLGYSMGGILSLIYTALDGRRVKNLVPLATPVDFKKAGALGAWTDARYFDVDRFVDTFGNVPAEMIHCSFRMLKPASNLTRPINLLQHVDDIEELKVLLALERWLIDSAPIPGEFYRQLVKALYQRNLLAQDALKIDGRTVKLSNISCSMLNVIGAHDQTVPPDSSRPLLNLISSLDKENLLLPYGHATLSIGSGAREDFWSKSSEWLKKRSGVGEKNGHRRMSRSRTARLKSK
jgi:polyhydroxyalkanoate synthase